MTTHKIWGKSLLTPPRGKLSTDPNNTSWSKSTTGFGHKMLSKQGWKPGDFLGAENANHSSHYTAANASHIKVMLREDNLGIGAKIGTQNAETFGLSMFSGLLGRLNGKPEDQAALQKKEQTLRDVQLKLKYGNMNFVSGGLLVGDKMQEVKSDLGFLKDGGAVVAVKESKSKKRKAESDDSEDEKSSKKRRKAETKANGTAAAIKEMKRKRRIEAGGEASAASDVPEQDADSSSSSSSSEDEKESKRRRKAERKAEKESKSTEGSISKDEKARLKEEKRARKEERRKRKEERRAKRAAKEAKKSKSKSSSAVASESEAQSGTSTPTFMGGRQAVRHRYIMQKRMAAGSAQALKEIFMMKPQVAS
jgi:Pin2-interacting protein X1